MTVAPKKPRTRRAKPFDWREKLKLANSFIEQHELSVEGELVCEFALPPELLKTENTLRHKHWTIPAGLKKKLFAKMGAQFLEQQGRISQPLPLKGKPLVVCYRFTKDPVDDSSNWQKFAVDILTVPTKKAPKRRLSIISEDDPMSIDTLVKWKPAKLSEGVCWIGVFPGKGE